MSQYIGKTISLISSKGIRYVGTLQDINGEEATVTLQNVKPFGTEGRLGDPSKEIPPSNETYPVVVFRGSDVHDLSVLDDAPAQETAPQASSEPAAAAAAQKPVYKSAQRPKNREQPAAASAAAATPKVQPFYLTQEIPKDDFDFESSNAQFEKTGKDQQPQEEEPAQPAYNKQSSFFDNLSTPVNNNNNNNNRRRSNYKNRSRYTKSEWNSKPEWN